MALTNVERTNSSEDPEAEGWGEWADEREYSGRVPGPGSRSPAVEHLAERGCTGGAGRCSVNMFNSLSSMVSKDKHFYFTKIQLRKYLTRIMRVSFINIAHRDLQHEKGDMRGETLLISNCFSCHRYWIELQLTHILTTTQKKTFTFIK